jgi:glycosyltransferase involved in cell wall biosynthesis
MACGIPILIGMHGDGADLVIQSGSGIICEPDNPSSMADKMIQMHNMSQKERREMGRRGRQYYEQNLSLNVSAKKMEYLFIKAANKSYSH